MEADAKFLAASPFALGLILVLFSPFSVGFFKFAIRGWFTETHGGIAPALVGPIAEIAMHIAFLNGAILTLLGAIIGVMPFLRQEDEDWLVPIDISAIVILAVLLLAVIYFIVPVAPAKFSDRIQVHWLRFFSIKQAAVSILLVSNLFFIVRIWLD